MKTTGIFSTHRVELEVELGKPFKLIPFGDVHRDSDLHADEHWKEFLAYAKKQKNAVFLGMGDYCMPMDAEILTIDGWKGFGSIKAGDRVYSYNRQLDCGEFVPVNYVYLTDDKPMVTLRSKSFEARVTPNHKWVTTSQGWIRSQFDPRNIATKDLKTYHRIKVATKMGRTLFCPQYGSEELISVADATRLGWIATEGHQRKECFYAIGVVQSAGSKYIGEIEAAFSELTTGRYYDSTSDCYTFNLSRPKTKLFLERIGYKSKSDLPGIAARLPMEQTEALFKTLLHGDGWKDKHNWRFSQKEGPVLDAFHILSAKLGIRLGRSVKDAATGVVTVSLMESRPYVGVADLEIEESDECESAWCINNDNSSFVMRWRGQVTLTGNCDGVSTSERIVLDGPSLHDTTRTTMRDHYRGVAKTLVNELSFMKGRLIGMLGGNHYFDFGNGDTTDHILAAALRTKFLGVCSFIRLSLRFRNATGTLRKHERQSLDIFAHHGKGGGGLPGSTFNTLEKMQQAADADFYCMGHDHRKGCIPSTPRLQLVSTGPTGELSVRERTPWLGRTGSFLKAYENGRVSYNVDAGRPPCALGWIEFEITPVRRNVGGVRRIEFNIRGTA